MIKLVKPDIMMQNMYMEYIQEWKDNNEDMVPTSSDLDENDYSSWLDNLVLYSNPNTCPSHLVPAETFLALNDEGLIVGVINLRHKLNSYLEQFGGHIAYGVRPTQRNKGYATKMLKELIPYAKDMNIKKLLITCDKLNIASQKTIIKCGGQFQNEVFDDTDNTMTQRYWIIT